MLFNLKVLASTLLSTVVFAVAVGSAEHLEKRAQLTGIDVSSWQGNVDWSTVKGIAFSYIKATEGTGKPDGVLVARCTDISFQATRTLTSPLSTTAPPTHTLFAVPITSLFLTYLPVLIRPTTLSPTVEVGLAMATPSQVPLVLRVPVIHFQHPRSTD